ncbi:bifunctional transaldolase/phosoglucose isomerase [Acetobacter fallax]|uniref:Transaldolase n=1 Tax=Acetobacter fallax TaxID=1737473 RepID=A0ABX0K5Y2_9PROT|nr:bifunctional transaldolase/phosoglucose isomerase [Acetobacter fallax]NHO31794.1 bifunctional transaldolase/phosoglucose isomerase [Acetobacter fallax]NHO35444.1 bifunctional transaldolase/phosoglucose isomerase [Acetobacter fallax]
MNATSSTGKSPLRELEQFDQSPWLDFVRRGYTRDGSMAKLIAEDGVKGVTSNPAIFQKAMGEGTDYDAQIHDILAHDTVSAGQLYERLAIQDIREVAKLLKPIFDATKALDGYVSLEVSPYLARDTQGTEHEAARLWTAVAEPNLMIKIPGTNEGVPAIEKSIADGININVTLLFSLNAYKKVVEAWLSGLEHRLKAGKPVSGIASVASFFVSRIDGKIDAEIDRRVKAGDADSKALSAVRGKVAIANAKLAWQYWLGVMKSDRWSKLKAAGAQPQRLLWASTGTKDKAYSDVLYLEELIGSETVNTIPPATLDAFRDHGKLRASLGENVSEAEHVMKEAERLGLDLEGITRTLVDEGVASFAEAFDSLLGSVAAKQNAILGKKLADTKLSLPTAFDEAVKKGLDTWRKAGTIRKLWARDASVWTSSDESKWLKWLDIVDDRLAHLKELEAFQTEVKARGFKQILLLGMGGSSLGPEVLAETFGKHEGFAHLYVLDSTDPQQVATFGKKIDPAHTLFIVSSKSGSTLEPNIMLAYFFDVAKKTLGEKAGQHFVAVTDPGSKLEAQAKKDGFWKVFFGEKQIGGRYSVLSNFGIVPAAASGVPLKLFLDDALHGVRASDSSVPPAVNPGVLLGTVFGVGATEFGRDKITIIATKQIADFGAWAEQLIAESTGKLGKGLIPVDDETLAGPKHYGKDRLFVYFRLSNEHSHEQDEAVRTLIDAGEPVVTINLHDRRQIAQEFFRWEIATAVAGAYLKINPFDQPDVEASKIETKKLTSAYNETGSLPAEAPFATDGDLAFFADAKNTSALKGTNTQAILKAHFDRVKPGDYVGLLAYIERDRASIEWIQHTRLAIRDAKTVATAAEFGPRFLHSTGQAYKGGPDTGVFLQITADDAHDLPVPGERYSFGVVKAAQARGDFDVLAERGRRALRVHIKGDLKTGLATLASAIKAVI